jgi:hypothetical protein
MENGSPCFKIIVWSISSYLIQLNLIKSRVIWTTENEQPVDTIHSMHAAQATIKNWKINE